MKVTATHKITGEKIPGNWLFINNESDGGSASLQTTIDNLEEFYELEFIPENDKKCLNLNDERRK